MASPSTTFTFSGCVLPVSLPLSFIVIPFSLKITFPSSTLFPSSSSTVAVNVRFSPITPLTVDTVMVVSALSVKLLYVTLPLRLYNLIVALNIDVVSPLLFFIVTFAVSTSIAS